MPQLFKIIQIFLLRSDEYTKACERSERASRKEFIVDSEMDGKRQRTPSSKYSQDFVNPLSLKRPVKRKSDDKGLVHEEPLELPSELPPATKSGKLLETLPSTSKLKITNKIIINIYFFGQVFLHLKVPNRKVVLDRVSLRNRLLDQSGKEMDKLRLALRIQLREYLKLTNPTIAGNLLVLVPLGSHVRDLPTLFRQHCLHTDINPSKHTLFKTNRSCN